MYPPLTSQKLMAQPRVCIDKVLNLFIDIEKMI